MDEIARAARVGKGTIYRYFRNKDDLFLRMVLGGTDELCEAIRRTAERPISFPRQMERIVSEAARTMLRHRQLLRLLHSEESRMPFMSPAMREQWRRNRRRLVDSIAAWLGRGVGAGHIRPDVPPETIAIGLLGMIRGFIMQQEPSARTAPRVGPMLSLFLEGAANHAAVNQP